jgi:hypothetical protein
VNGDALLGERLLKRLLGSDGDGLGSLIDLLLLFWGAVLAHAAKKYR